MQEIQKSKIMVIDDNIINLNIARKALEELYDVILIPSGEKALNTLSKIIPDLILLDVDMPDLDGFEVIQRIKEMPVPICDIPIIFLTAKDDTDSEFEGLDLGAVDYIFKPFSFALLIKRIALHLKLAHQQSELLNYSLNLEQMIKKKTHEVTQLQYSVVHVLSDMVEKRDGSTGGHLLRTREYLKVFLQKILKEERYKDILEDIDIELYAHASQMHDVGKISIPDSILLKEGRLTSLEFEVMQQHTIIGENAIKYAMTNIQEAEFLRIAAEFASTHHEKWDGSGYPKGLKEEEIPLSGRLMAIIDVYDALISTRPYKASMPHKQAVEIIINDSGKHFDPHLVCSFKKIANVFEKISELYK